MMAEKTTLDHMQEAMRQYWIEQPDSYTVVIYGPNGFYELHDSFSTAFERKEELALLAALKAIMVPSKTIADAGRQAMKQGKAKQVWQAFLCAIINEHKATEDRTAERLDDKIKALAPSP